MFGRLNKLAFQISAFMAGRNGLDKLSVFLLVSALIINGVNSFIRALSPSLALYAVSAALLGLILFRTLSKNIHKRQNENAAFGNFLGAVRFAETFDKARRVQKNIGLRLRYIKTHRFRKCRGCGEMLRLSRKRGKREFPCPKCGRKIKTRIWF